MTDPVIQITVPLEVMHGFSVLLSGFFLSETVQQSYFDVSRP